MIVGGYTLHLYCDFGEGGATNAPEHPMGEFSAATMTVCYADARRKGWKIYEAQGKAKCPACVAKGNK